MRDENKKKKDLVIELKALRRKVSLIEKAKNKITSDKSKSGLKCIHITRVFDNFSEGCMLIGYDWTFLYVNNSARQNWLKKRKALIGKNLLEIFPDIEKTEIFIRYKRCMEERTPQEFESTFSFTSGTVNWYWISVQPVPEGIFVLTLDITKSKLAEETQKLAEGRLNEAQRIAHIGSWELDLIKDNLIWSNEIYRMFEICPEKFGASYEAFLNTIHPEDREAVNAAYINSLKNRTPYSIEHRLLFSDGRIKFVHEECQTFYDEKGLPLRSVGTVQDITERKLHEQSIDRLNRVYKVLSETNQLIVREKNRGQLLKEICRIAVEDGELLLACMGFVDERTHRVIPDTWFGKEEGYFSIINFSIDDIPEGKGPTGTAIRENRFVFSTDIATEPMMEPWREPALQRNYRSSAAFPLREKDKVIGAFTVFAGEPAFFNKEELDLLNELSMDISYALENIQAEEIRVRAEELLRQSEEKYRNIFEGSFDGLFITSPGGKILDMNKKGISMFGYDTKEEMCKLDLATNVYANPADRQRILSMVNAQGSAEYEVDVKKKNGEIMPTHCSLVAVKDSLGEIDSYRGIIRDISKQKQSEKALRESEERYHSVFENSIDAVFLTRPDGRILAANPEACRIFGRTEEELCLLGRESIIDKTDPLLAAALEERASTGRFKGELTFIRKDGTKFPGLIASNTFLDKEGNKQTSTVIHDITDQKRAEEALCRLNRELCAISNCNQTLLRAADEQTLLNNICRIICDEAGYRLAWVGYVEHDDTKTIRPVAWAGFDSGYIANAKLSWSGDTERGRGPAGKAIRSGETIYVQDFTTESQMAPWRESALQRGYRSGIALPLKDESAKVFGVLLIYSTEVNAITPDEIRLMEELSNDLAFGITALRTRSERKRAESELQRSNDLLRAIIEAAPTAIFDLDLDGNVKTVWNPAAEKMLGWKAQEVIGNLLPTVSIEKQEEFKRFREQIRSGKILDGIEVRRQKRDGTPIDYCIYASPLYDAEGCVTGNVAVLMDITERKRTENVILESERRFKELANLLPQTIYEADINGIITFANETALTNFGYSAEEISQGVNMINMVSEKDRTEAIENMQRILKGITPSKNEYEMIRKNGTTFPALTFSAPIIQNERSIGLRGTIVDITQQKLAENELRKLSEAVAQSPASIVITDLDGDIEYVNKTFEETTGYLLNDVIHRNARILQSGHTKKEEYKILWGTITSGKTWRGEFLNKKKNGELYWEDAFISPIKDRNGNTINYLAVKQDITEKKKIIQELIEAKEEAIKANELKSEFLAQISHEIRTPLHVIMSMVSLVEEEFSNQLSEDLLQCFTSINSSGRRIIRTVDLILNVSEMQVGTYQPIFRNINLINDVFNQIIKEYIPKAKEKGLNFNIGCNISNPVVLGDSYSINQIFINLVDNAMKYTNQGSIKVIIDKNKDDYPYVSVEDTGIGISEEFIPKLFEPFMQEDRGYTRKYEGNGLGLALVKKYCDLNDLTINVESKKNIGSIFTITFRKRIT